MTSPTNPKKKKVRDSVQQSKHHSNYVFSDNRVFGFDLFGDLAAHYDFLEYLYLLCTQDFPTPLQKKGLGLLLRALTLCPANATSLHAARASRCSGAEDEATILCALLTTEEEQCFDEALKKELGLLNYHVDSVSQAFLALGISPAFAKTLSLMFSSFGTLAEAFRGEAIFSNFPATLPPYEYEP